MHRLLSASALILALAALAPGAAQAQVRQQPDSTRAHEEQDAQMREQIQQLQAMMPMIAATLRNVTQGTMSALAEPEVARNLARFTRNYYEALMAEGFTREEALRIVSSIGFPSIPNM